MCTVSGEDDVVRQYEDGVLGGRAVVWRVGGGTARVPNERRTSTRDHMGEMTDFLEHHKKAV